MIFAVAAPRRSRREGGKRPFAAAYINVRCGCSREAENVLTRRLQNNTDTLAGTGDGLTAITLTERSVAFRTRNLNPSLTDGVYFSSCCEETTGFHLEDGNVIEVVKE
jgi:hypothetical protein